MVGAGRDDPARSREMCAPAGVSAHSGRRRKSTAAAAAGPGLPRDPPSNCRSHVKPAAEGGGGLGAKEEEDDEDEDDGGDDEK